LAWLREMMTNLSWGTLMMTVRHHYITVSQPVPCLRAL
jgi:hypothetical protein